MENKSFGIVIIGGDLPCYGLMRILVKEKIPFIILYENKIDWIIKSKYCKNFIQIDTNLNLVDFLINLKPKIDIENWLLIPLYDKYVEIIAINKYKLLDKFKISTDNWDIIKQFLNKNTMYKLLDKLDVKIPVTFFIDKISDIDNIKLKFPCIIKPNISYKFSDIFYKKAELCHNIFELKSNLNNILKYFKFDEILIQEFIPNNINNLFSACFFYNKNETMVSLTVCKNRQYPILFGDASTNIETIIDKELILISEQILSSLKYFGVCEIEFIKDPNDGIYKVIDINTRFWGWHFIADKSKSPFLLSLYYFIYFNKTLKETTFKKTIIKNMILDFLSLKQAKKNIFKRNFIFSHDLVFNIFDILPFFYYLRTLYKFL